MIEISNSVPSNIRQISHLSCVPPAQSSGVTQFKVAVFALWKVIDQPLCQVAVFLSLGVIYWTKCAIC